MQIHPIMAQESRRPLWLDILLRGIQLTTSSDIKKTQLASSGYKSTTLMTLLGPNWPQQLKNVTSLTAGSNWPQRLKNVTSHTAGTNWLQRLTLSGAAPFIVLMGGGGHIVPPLGFRGCWGVMVPNFCCNLRSYSDWHQTKGFTTFRYLEPPQLMVWKIYFFRGFWRFVRVLPYESWAFWTNFYFSWKNGEFFWSKIFCNLFHTKS